MYWDWQKFVSWDEFFFDNPETIDYRDIDLTRFKEACPYNFVVTCNENVNFLPREKSFFDSVQLRDEWTYFILRKEKEKDKDIDECVFEDYDAFFFFRNESDAIMARMML